MTPDSKMPWLQVGANVATHARDTGRFIFEYLSPLFFWRTTVPAIARPQTDIVSEDQFWAEDRKVAFGAVSLNGFRLTDWFPRTPGVFWSSYARRARERTWSREPEIDPLLGRYFCPKSKMNLIEEGGIGTIRLLPRKIDGNDCWLATALTGTLCHGGIPLAIPISLLQKSGVIWGDRVRIQGRVRFFKDLGLDDISAGIHHAQPMIVVVDKLRGIATRRSPDPIVITPVALFAAAKQRSRNGSEEPQYTFVNCSAGADSELDAAGDWIEEYSRKYKGHVITNFDEKRPILADAPLSYQRLVAKTYDRAILKDFGGSIQIQRVDAIIQHSGKIHMGHKINVGGSAIINIDSVLTKVTQTIGESGSLDAAQKSKLDTMVESLKSDLEKIKATHADEAKEIAVALEKAVANASKPPEERKKSILHLSAQGLKEAAKLVKDVAPDILVTATLVAKFMSGL